MKIVINTYRLIGLFILLLGSQFAHSQNDSTLRYPIKDKRSQNPGYTSPYQLKDPSNLTTKVVYDPQTGKYIVTRYLGGQPMGFPMYYTPEEYQEYKLKTGNTEELEREIIQQHFHV